MRVITPGLSVTKHCSMRAVTTFFWPFTVMLIIYYRLGHAGYEQRSIYALELPSEEELISELQRLNPVEILISKSFQTMIF